MIELTVKDNAVLLPVKVVPGAARTRYLGEWRGRARIAVTAPPEKGRANDAVIAFLAKKLGVRRQALHIVAGTTSPLKTVKIEGIALDALRTLFASEPPDRN